MSKKPDPQEAQGLGPSEFERGRRAAFQQVADAIRVYWGQHHQVVGCISDFCQRAAVGTAAEDTYYAKPTPEEPSVAPAEPSGPPVDPLA